MSTIEKLKAQIGGRWDNVVLALAPELDEAIKHKGHHTACPVHGGTDGFRVFKDFSFTGGGVCNTCGFKSDGFALLAWVTNKDLKTVVKDVDEVLNGVAPIRLPKPKPMPALKKDDGEKATKRLRKVWSESLKYAGYPAELMIGSYLDSRGLPKSLYSLLSGVVGVHPALPYRRKEKDGSIKDYGCHPALVALVEDMNGEALTIHRTYLEQWKYGWRKSSAVPKAKTIMPIKSGSCWSTCAIQVGAHNGETLNIAEGLETSLAVIALGESHCWAAISASNIANFRPPAGVKRLVVWADKDRNDAGSNACAALREKLPKEVELVVRMPPIPIPPDKKGVDWLDYYNQLPRA